MSGTERVQLVFDGGSLGNPGRGYGSYRWRRGDGAWSPPVRLEFGARVTNNEAEYRSLIAGLEALRELLTAPSAAHVEVLTDSRLVAEQMRGRWKLRAANLAPLQAAAARSASAFAGVSYRWQPRARSVELLGH